MTIKTNSNEILRYLGVNGIPSKEISKQIEILTKELQDKLSPKHVTGRYACTISNDTVSLNGIEIKSSSLAKHLNDCNEVVILSATLGIVADNLLRRYSVTDIAKAAMIQAICAAMIEDYCDFIQQEVENQLLNENLFLTSRFSPGYSDFSIVHQKDILSMLQCNKKIGLTISDSYMLSPTKSVTAIMGITKKRCEHHDKCSQCNQSNCAYKKL